MTDEITIRERAVGEAPVSKRHTVTFRQNFPCQIDKGSLLILEFLFMKGFFPESLND